jgi:hypothetical protein
MLDLKLEQKITVAWIAPAASRHTGTEALADVKHRREQMQYSTLSGTDTAAIAREWCRRCGLRGQKEQFRSLQRPSLGQY